MVYRAGLVKLSIDGVLKGYPWRFINGTGVYHGITGPVRDTDFQQLYSLFYFDLSLFY
jgi:hypothetical protein